MKRYIVYRCKICNKHTILIKEEVTHSEKESQYLTCGHNGRHKNLIVVGAYDNIEECMDNHYYIRVYGRVHQVK